ncbi:MAG: hypothetical protein H7338_18950 [Candidatus Sericytochromatia bacterium]|nr:hypothetical protein [Candidatus Sericytochromatia bacterium]
MARTTDESIYLILNLGTAMAQAEDLTELYEAIGFGAQLAYDMYPHIDCHTGCNRCCTNNSMPIVSPIEFVRVYDSVKALPAVAQQELIGRVRDWHERFGPSLWAMHTGLQGANTTEKFEKIAKALEVFTDCSCPFVVMGKCSIYDNRPAKCRAHGAYLLRIGQEVQMHTCAEEVDKMEAHLAEQGSRRVAMPFWNPAEDRLNRLNAPGVISTILANWLIAHIDGGQFIAEANPTPDWQAVQARYPDMF